MQFRIIGPGRAGGAFALALSSVGWTHVESLGRDDDLSRAADSVELVLLTVPDNAISTVAAAIQPADATVVHVAGSQRLDVLAPHESVGSIHPLMTLPNATSGAERLLASCRFAVAGDDVCHQIANALGGVAFSVEENNRATYHAAASIASNHLVALTAQVQRLAEQAGVPPDAYWQLMEASLANVIATDPATALTGPAARGDWNTIRKHLATLDRRDRRLYLALMAEAATLATQALPDDLS